MTSNVNWKCTAEIGKHVPPLSHLVLVSFKIVLWQKVITLAIWYEWLAPSPGNRGAFMWVCMFSQCLCPPTVQNHTRVFWDLIFLWGLSVKENGVCVDAGMCSTMAWWPVQGIFPLFTLCVFEMDTDNKCNEQVTQVTKDEWEPWQFEVKSKYFNVNMLMVLHFLWRKLNPTENHGIHKSYFSSSTIIENIQLVPYKFHECRGNFVQLFRVLESLVHPCGPSHVVWRSRRQMVLKLLRKTSVLAGMSGLLKPFRIRCWLFRMGRMRRFCWPKILWTID